MKRNVIRELTAGELKDLRAYASLHGDIWKPLLWEHWRLASRTISDRLHALRDDPAWGLRGLNAFKLPASPQIVVRVLGWEGYPMTPLAGAMPSLATALRHASTSGYAPGSGIAGYPECVRAGRVWIEDRKKPATALKDYERSA